MITIFATANRQAGDKRGEAVMPLGCYQPLERSLYIRVWEESS